MSRRRACGHRPEETDQDSSQGRFFVSELPSGDEEFTISGPEAAHAGGSRRLSAGDSLTLFDGSGWDVTVEIVAVGKRSLTVRPVSRRHVGRPMPVPVTCFTALPKGSRDDFLVSKCAEIGVTRLAATQFARSVTDAAVRWDNRKARYMRLAVEASKQCDASTVMEVVGPVDFKDIVASPPPGARLMGVPRADLGVIQALDRLWPFEAVSYIVGPEGDLTPEEREAAVAVGFVPVNLACTTLRVETAATAFAAVIAAFLVGKAGAQTPCKTP